MKNYFFIFILFLTPAFLCAQGLSYKWTKTFGSATPDFGRAVAIDGAGNVYSTGTFTGTVDFDPGPGTNNLISSDV